MFEPFSPLVNTLHDSWNHDKTQRIEDVLSHNRLLSRTSWDGRAFYMSCLHLQRYSIHATAESPSYLSHSFTLFPVNMQDMQSLSELSAEATQVFYHTVAILLESVLYGSQIVIAPFAVHILLKQGARSASNVLLLCAVLVPLVLCTAYWILEVIVQVLRIKVYFMKPQERHMRNIIHFHSLFDAIIRVNYIISDAIVVWRAYILCRDYRRSLMAGVFCLIMTISFILAAIVIKISSFIWPEGPNFSRPRPFTHAFDICQVLALAWSFFTNAAATATIAHKAWAIGLRKKVQGEPSGVGETLSLIIESGLLYSLSAIMLIVFAIVQLPHGKLGDIYNPTSYHIAGIYPAIIIVLVRLQRTTNGTTHWRSSELITCSEADAIVTTHVHGFDTDLDVELEHERKTEVLDA